MFQECVDKFWASGSVTNPIIGIVGLGYVGLPLAVEFAKKFSVIGFDINENRIEQLNSKVDLTNEVSAADLEQTAEKVSYTTDPNRLKKCNVIIVTVPTPIDEARNPNLSPLIAATKCVGKVMSEGTIVVYESTVYPGCTEEVCVPLLETTSNLSINKSFFVGYSPERINPGDKVNRLPNITKIVSASTNDANDYLKWLYGEIISAGIYVAETIQVAEAAKVIENTQRDVNIALINELETIFDRLNIDTHAVLQASGTKWNFLNFTPGLVGGHCIGVDPYYLLHKSKTVGLHAKVIGAGRLVNDEMHKHYAQKVIKMVLSAQNKKRGRKVLVLGMTFKENCPDTRNSKSFELISELESYGILVDTCDPWVRSDKRLPRHLGNLPKFDEYAAVVIAVAHDHFKDYYDELLKYENVVDIKGALKGWKKS